jgi:hypothetical protein
MDDFMSLIQWINGEPFAVGLHRKKFLVGGFENLADIEREALMYERDWHERYGLKGNQYIMKFQQGGVVSLNNDKFDISKVLMKAINNLGYVPDFIKRSLNKATQSLEVEGQPATVRMMQQDNYAFPTIFPLETPMGRVLTELSPQAASNRAFKEGEYLEFDSENEAKFFAENFSNLIPER